MVSNSWLGLVLIFVLTGLLYTLHSKKEYVGGTGDQRNQSSSNKIIYLCYEDSEEENDLEKPCDGEACDLVPFTDFYGNTYRSERKKSPEECCQSCFRDPECKSFTFDSREQICRLKNKDQGTGTPCPYRTSGRPKASLPRPEPTESKGKNNGLTSTSSWWFTDKEKGKAVCRRRPVFK